MTEETLHVEEIAVSEDGRKLTASDERAEETEAHEEGPHVQLAAEPAFQIGNFTVTNTMTATVVTTLLVVLFGLWVRKGMGIIPSRVQVLFETVFLEFYDRLEEAVGEKKARLVAPMIVTFFLFLIIGNLFILLPIVGNLVTEHGHFMRTPTSDYSMTIALALFSIGALHLIAFTASPLGHLGAYFRVKGIWEIVRGEKPIANLLLAVIDFLLGLLEILGDIVKIISLATRLFGNIIAGEVVIIVISGLMFFTQFFVPIPFIVMASFAGLIQAFVFALLSTIFISNSLAHATSHGGAGDH